MLLENDSIAKEMGSLAACACMELFDAYGVRLEASKNRWGESDARLLCGVIGFVGSGVRGTCLLTGSEPPLSESCPAEGELRDWVGELANQLAGRLKTKFLDRGVDAGSSTQGLSAAAPAIPSRSALHRRANGSATRANTGVADGAVEQGFIVNIARAEADQRCQAG